MASLTPSNPVLTPEVYQTLYSISNLVTGRYTKRTREKGLNIAIDAIMSNLKKENTDSLSLELVDLLAHLRVVTLFLSANQSPLRETTEKIKTILIKINNNYVSAEPPCATRTPSPFEPSHLEEEDKKRFAEAALPSSTLPTLSEPLAWRLATFPLLSQTQWESFCKVNQGAEKLLEVIYSKFEANEWIYLYNLLLMPNTPKEIISKRDTIEALLDLYPKQAAALMGKCGRSYLFQKLTVSPSSRASSPEHCLTKGGFSMHSAEGTITLQSRETLLPETPPSSTSSSNSDVREEREYLKEVAYLIHFIKDKNWKEACASLDPCFEKGTATKEDFLELLEEEDDLLIELERILGTDLLQKEEPLLVPLPLSTSKFKFSIVSPNRSAMSSTSTGSRLQFSLPLSGFSLSFSSGSPEVSRIAPLGGLRERK